MSRYWLVSGLAVAVTLALAPAANGASLYSNLAGGGADSSGTGQVDIGQRLAQPFVPTQAGTARLVGFYGVSYLGAPATVSISIHSDSGGQPGALLATSAQVVIDADSDGVPTCTALNATPSLATNQTYWAVFRTHNGNDGFWSTASQGGSSPRMSFNDGVAWNPPAGAARSLLVDDSTSCNAEISTIPAAGGELSDMYATPGGTSFQTLTASNSGNAELRLTGGSFTGLSPNTPANMFVLLQNNHRAGVPPGTPFVFPKTLGSASGGVIFMYISCEPPPGQADGLYSATFRLTSNDPDEGLLTWPVVCIIDSTPPSLEFIQNPNGRADWFVTNPAPLQIRGIDPESGNRVKRIFCSDNGAPNLNWPNGSFALFDIVGEGIHSLSCQGTDVANNTSEPGAYTTAVKIDPTPPETIQGGEGPAPLVDVTTATFSFTGTDATSGIGEFECSLDGGPYELCSSPATRGGLGNATHTFDVRARDVAGNYDPTPVRWTWDVNAPAPQAVDDSAAAVGGGALDIDVLANDLAPRGEPLFIVLGGDTTAKDGAVSVAGSTVHYVPPAGFAGTDRFSYRAVNGQGVTSEPATVTVEVEARSGPGVKCTVPKLPRGASKRAVKRGLKAASCSAGKVKRKYSETVARGKLIKLRKKPGKVLAPGAKVGIVLSKGPR